MTLLHNLLFLILVFSSAMARGSLSIRRCGSSRINWIRFTAIHGRWEQKRRGSIRKWSIRMPFHRAPRKTKGTKSIPSYSPVQVIMSRNEGVTGILWSGTYTFDESSLGVWLKTWRKDTLNFFKVLKRADIEKSITAHLILKVPIIYFMLNKLFFFDYTTT